MSSDVFWLLVGAAIGAAGAIVGGFVQGLASDWFERRRAAAEKREQWTQTALHWDTHGRKDNLRHADLQGADLRGADLGVGKDGDEGADLSYANLRRADLRDADLAGADLTGADLRNAALGKAILMGADLTGARYDQKTRWPDGFTPPPEAIKVEDNGGHD
jgi:hypothetical protein